MVLCKLPVLGRPTIWMTVGQGPIVLAVGAGGGCLDIFTFVCPFSPLSPSLWETARYRLKYCLKGPLNSKQPTNQPFSSSEKILLILLTGKTQLGLDIHTVLSEFIIFELTTMNPEEQKKRLRTARLILGFAGRTWRKIRTVTSFA